MLIQLQEYRWSSTFQLITMRKSPCTLMQLIKDPSISISLPIRFLRSREFLRMNTQRKNSWRENGREKTKNWKTWSMAKFYPGDLMHFSRHIVPIHWTLIEASAFSHLDRAACLVKFSSIWFQSISAWWSNEISKHIDELLVFKDDCVCDSFLS